MTVPPGAVLRGSEWCRQGKVGAVFEAQEHHIEMAHRGRAILLGSVNPGSMVKACHRRVVVALLARDVQRRRSAPRRQFHIGAAVKKQCYHVDAILLARDEQRGDALVLRVVDIGSTV